MTVVVVPVRRHSGNRPGVMKNMGPPAECSEHVQAPVRTEGDVDDHRKAAPYDGGRLAGNDAIDVREPLE